MNKNLLSLLLFLPLIIALTYHFAGNQIINFIKAKMSSKESQTTNSLALDLTNTNLKTESFNEYISTDDNKGLGYTGQNKIAIDSKGNIYFVYREKVEGKYEIFITKIDKNKNLVFNKPVTDIKSTQRVPSMTIDYRDNIHIVWYGIDINQENLGRQIKYIKSANGGETWTNPINIGPVTGYKQEDYWQEHPQISSFEKNLFIVWEGKDENNQNQQIKIATSANSGQTWTKWRNVYLTTDSTQSRPSAIVDAKGQLHLFFYSTLGEESQEIRYLSSNDLGKTWTNPIKISNNSKNDSRHVAASYLKNKIIAVWREGPKDYDLGVAQIYYSILDLTDNKWTEPQIVAKSNKYQLFPAITTNGSTAIISWMETEDNSDFPNEDPEAGKLYITKLDLTKKEISKARQIDANAAYPNLTLDIENDTFYLLYQQGGIPSQIILKSGKF